VPPVNYYRFVPAPKKNRSSKRKSILPNSSPPVTSSYRTLKSLSPRKLALIDPLLAIPTKIFRHCSIFFGPPTVGGSASDPSYSVWKSRSEAFPRSTPHLRGCKDWCLLQRLTTPARFPAMFSSCRLLYLCKSSWGCWNRSGWRTTGGADHPRSRNQIPASTRRRPGNLAR
jgi:hypothetical protein